MPLGAQVMLYMAVDAQAMHASSCIGKTAIDIKKHFLVPIYRRSYTEQIDTNHSELKHFLHIL